MRSILLLPSFLLIAACATPGVSAPTSTAANGVTKLAAERGLAFATAHCSTCHAVGSGSSPNKDAPSFEDVINTPGLTAETLTPWLANSHNFPEIMSFAIAPEHIEDLAAHMLTLKDPNYKPRI